MVALPPINFSHALNYLPYPTNTDKRYCQLCRFETWVSNLRHLRIIPHAWGNPHDSVISIGIWFNNTVIGNLYYLLTSGDKNY